MSNVVQFPRTRARDRTSGIRVAYFDGRWCVERLVERAVVDRRFMPTQADAERIAGRISRRDKMMLLTARGRRPRPWPSFHMHTPGAA